MIGDAWFKLLCLPFIVVIAFLLFCTALVAYLIGYIDPHSSPGAELRKLGTIIERCTDWIRS